MHPSGCIFLIKKGGEFSPPFCLHFLLFEQGGHDFFHGCLVFDAACFDCGVHAPDWVSYVDYWYVDFGCGDGGDG